MFCVAVVFVLLSNHQSWFPHDFMKKMTFFWILLINTSLQYMWAGLLYHTSVAACRVHANCSKWGLFAIGRGSSCELYKMRSRIIH